MVSFISGIYDIDTIPPHEIEDYNITELPINADSKLEFEEKLDIIFNLSEEEKVKYEHYMYKLSTCRGEQNTLDRLAAEPEFTQERNNFIYEHLDGTPDRFIKGIIGKYYDTLQRCEGLTYTDLIQEGWIGLIKAAKKFEEKQGFKFSTYAYYWVQKYILKTLDKEIKTSIAESEYDQKKFETSIEEEAFTIHKMEQLDEREQEILELYASGYTQEEISGEVSFQISQQHVSRILDKIKANV